MRTELNLNLGSNQGTEYQLTAQTHTYWPHLVSWSNTWWETRSSQPSGRPGVSESLVGNMVVVCIQAYGWSKLSLKPEGSRTIQRVLFPAAEVIALSFPHMKDEQINSWIFKTCNEQLTFPMYEEHRACYIALALDFSIASSLRHFRQCQSLPNWRANAV